MTAGTRRLLRAISLVWLTAALVVAVAHRALDAQLRNTFDSGVAHD